MNVVMAYHGCPCSAKIPKKEFPDARLDDVFKMVLAVLCGRIYFHSKKAKKKRNKDALIYNNSFPTHKVDNDNSKTIELAEFLHW